MTAKDFRINLAILLCRDQVKKMQKNCLLTVKEDKNKFPKKFEILETFNESLLSRRERKSLNSTADTPSELSISSLSSRNVLNVPLNRNSSRLLGLEFKILKKNNLSVKII